MDFGGPNLELLQGLMSASMRRAEVLSHNIANQNTPGFQRQYVRFEELLREAYESGKDPTAVRPQIEVDTITPSRPDGNNVTLESEMNSLRQNRLLYDAYAAILAGRFEVLRSSIQDNS